MTFQSFGYQLFPSSWKEATKLVDPLNQTLLSKWAPRKH